MRKSEEKLLSLLGEICEHLYRSNETPKKWKQDLAKKMTELVVTIEEEYE